MNNFRWISWLVAITAGAALVALPGDANAWRQCAVSAKAVPGDTTPDWGSPASTCARQNLNYAERTLAFALPVETSSITHTVSVWGRDTSSSKFWARFVGMDDHGVVQFTTPMVFSAQNGTSQNLALATITPVTGQGCALFVEAHAGYQATIDEVTWAY